MSETIETIEVVQFNGKNADEVCDFMGEENYVWDGDKLLIVRLEGNMTVSKNDYIIKGLSGEFYSRSKDFFDETLGTESDEYDGNLMPNSLKD